MGQKPEPWLVPSFLALIAFLAFASLTRRLPQSFEELVTMGGLMTLVAALLPSLPRRWWMVLTVAAGVVLSLQSAASLVWFVVWVALSQSILRGTGLWLGVLSGVRLVVFWLLSLSAFDPGAIDGLRGTVVWCLYLPLVSLAMAWRPARVGVFPERWAVLAPALARVCAATAAVVYAYENVQLATPVPLFLLALLPTRLFARSPVLPYLLGLSFLACAVGSYLSVPRWPMVCCSLLLSCIVARALRLKSW
jgi:hypothetical protein